MNPETNPRYFRGQMDEIRFWNVARQKEEIISGMNSHIDPASEGLVAYYDFNRSDEGPDFDRELDTFVYLAPVVKGALNFREKAAGTNK